MLQWAMAASRRRRPVYMLLGVGAVIALWLAWPGLFPPAPRESVPAVQVALSPPAPAPQATPTPAPLSQPAPLPATTPPPPAEPKVAAVPPAPSSVPAPPPEPFVVDRKAIARVQYYLEQLGYQIGAADGALGRRTKVAIAAFRKANALPKGEEVDAALLDALDFAVAQLPKTKPAEGVPAAAPRIPVARTPLPN